MRLFFAHKPVVGFCLIGVAAVIFSGCGDSYSNGWPYPDKVQSVYVEMFGSQSLRRGAEYKLTDAICKQIEVQTPYKIISDRNRADSILYGEILSIGDSVITTEPEVGTTIEKEARVEVVFSWKDLNTGQMYVNEKTVIASDDYSMGQDFPYGADVAVNIAAKRVVESMRIPW